jgi:membrane protein implicated in regulation of membrane protease activity
VALVVGVLLAVFVVPEPWGYAAVAAGGAIEVAEAGYWLRWTRLRKPEAGAEALIGTMARVVEPCRPDGRVRVRGELWAARCPEGADAGEQVRVLALDGLTLFVERE